MKFRLIIIYFLSLLAITTSGQRMVNKILFIFPKNTSVDTFKNKFPYKFILTLDSSIKLSNLPQEKGDPIPKKPKSFFKPTPSDIHLTDSLMKADILKAVIAGDSLLYVKNQLYLYNDDKATDFNKYKANRNSPYEKLARENLMKIKRSDKYYFGYVNQQDKKRIVVCSTFGNAEP